MLFSDVLFKSSSKVTPASLGNTVMQVEPPYCCQFDRNAATHLEPSELLALGDLVSRLLRPADTADKHCCALARVATGRPLLTSDRNKRDRNRLLAFAEVGID